MVFIKRFKPNVISIIGEKMIKKETVKYWISREELFNKFGFKENDLLMGIEVIQNIKNPLGYTIQGIDLFIEHLSETNNENKGGEVMAKKIVKKEVKKVKKGAK